MNKDVGFNRDAAVNELSRSKYFPSPYLQALPEAAVKHWLTNASVPQGTYSEHETWLLNVASNTVTITPNYIVAALCELKTHRLAAVSRLNHDNFRLAIEQDLLIEAHAFDSIFPKIYSLELEINRGCNYRCTFCPVSIFPKRSGYMLESTFDCILLRASDYGVRQISVNHYSEPTLHPYFADWVAKATKSGLEVVVFTNASRLDRMTIDKVATMSRVSLVVNLPTCDEQEYRRVMNGKDLAKVMSNIEHAYALHIPVTIVVNCIPATRTATIAALKRRFPDVRVEPWRTDDRAGILPPNEYFAAQHHSGPLNGCSLIMRDLSVAWNGSVFLCAQDYHQKYVLGNLLESPLEEIVQSTRSRQLRRWIFGLENAPDDLICRRCAWTRCQNNVPVLVVGGRGPDADYLHYSELLSRCTVRQFGCKLGCG